MSGWIIQDLCSEEHHQLKPVQRFQKTPISGENNWLPNQERSQWNKTHCLFRTLLFPFSLSFHPPGFFIIIPLRELKNPTTNHPHALPFHFPLLPNCTVLWLLLYLQTAHALPNGRRKGKLINLCERWPHHRRRPINDRLQTGQAGWKSLQTDEWARLMQHRWAGNNTELQEFKLNWFKWWKERKAQMICSVLLVVLMLSWTWTEAFNLCCKR